MGSLNVILLLVGQDQNGVLRLCGELPAQSSFSSAGIAMTLSGIMPPSQEMRLRAAECIEQELSQDSIYYLHFIDDGVFLEEGVSSSVYLMRIKQQVYTAPKSWKTMAEILRQHKSGKLRNVYNKVLQVLAGALESEISALEVDDEVRRRLELEDKS